MPLPLLAVAQLCSNCELKPVLGWWGVEHAPATVSFTKLLADYLKKADCSVIFVHYESYTDFNCYAEALENIKHVGSCVAKLLSEFIFELGVQDIHLIAYSLGGHVANYIAKSLHPHKLPRITALDAPALFVDDEFRLDQSDAEFVDAFYTSALNLGQNRGHAAFYFNGGFIQPGCYLGE